MLSAHLNKGDFYKNQVAGLHLPHIFMGSKMVVTCCCTISEERAK